MTVRNMCTTMVLSGKMSKEALSNDLRTSLIEQYITIYHEEVVDFGRGSRRGEASNDAIGRVAGRRTRTSTARGTWQVAGELENVRS